MPFPVETTENGGLETEASEMATLQKHLGQLLAELKLFPYLRLRHVPEEEKRDRSAPIIPCGEHPLKPGKLELFTINLLLGNGD